MTSRRLLKAAEAIREVVASAILTELRDPRVKNVTVISVDVAPDMREAKVHVSVMGSEKQKQNSIRGLQNSAGFLQQQISNKIESRYIPRLQFVLNKGADNAMAVGELLAKIREEKEERSLPTEDETSQADISRPDPNETAPANDATTEPG
ncbi:30S ribosome-binding factor RbfA [Planctomycetes bacterium K23_9]|uniref:Ribosome-binding factor A n=1 Tax=Stieleria marina TaxID=1930275 RepID=A0A517NSD8_9BACT|nr:Ribosome-binding factor A [Planctomycetes bacterium K23_9]